MVKTLTNLQSLDKLPYTKYIFYNWLAVVSCGPCGLPPSIAYGEGWSGQWLCAGPHPANTYSPPPLRPRVHTYTGSQWPFRSVKKVPRARNPVTSFTGCPRTLYLSCIHRSGLYNSNFPLFRAPRCIEGTKSAVPRPVTGHGRAFNCYLPRHGLSNTLFLPCVPRDGANRPGLKSYLHGGGTVMMP